MSKIARTLAGLAIVALSLPAAAGSWPNPRVSRAPAKAAQSSPPNVQLAATVAPDGFVGEAGETGWTLQQYRYFRDEDAPNIRATAPRVTTRSAPAVKVATEKESGFAYIGGEAGWQPASHKLVMKAGRLEHSDECDHEIRVVKAPTQAELDEFRSRYSGG